MESIGKFLVGVQQEFSRVVWPTMQDLMGAVAVCLLLVVFYSVYLGLIDFSLNRLAGYIF